MLAGGMCHVEETEVEQRVQIGGGSFGEYAGGYVEADRRGEVSHDDSN